MLVGRTLTDNLLVTFEIEAAKAMRMPMGKAGQWMEHAPSSKESFHIDDLYLGHHLNAHGRDAEPRQGAGKRQSHAQADDTAA